MDNGRPRLIAATALAAVAIGAPLGITTIILFGGQVPPELAAIAGAAVGALSTFLQRVHIDRDA